MIIYDKTHFNTKTEVENEMLISNEQTKILLILIEVTIDISLKDQHMKSKL